MKNLLSIAAFALLTASLFFTGCRNDAGTQNEQTEDTTTVVTPMPVDTMSTDTMTDTTTTDTMQQPQ